MLNQLVNTDGSTLSMGEVFDHHVVTNCLKQFRVDFNAL